LVAATTGDLRPAVDREDVLPELFYLLTPLSIELPPLRRRGEDLPLLAQHFLEAMNPGSDKQVTGLAEGVLEKFREYNWPGNLDELAAVLEEARTACRGSTIGLGDLPFRFRSGLDAQAVAPSATFSPEPLEEYLARIEAEQIRRALKQSRQNKSKAAELLGVTRARLYRRMEALGIDDAGDRTEAE